MQSEMVVLKLFLMYFVAFSFNPSTVEEATQVGDLMSTLRKRKQKNSEEKLEAEPPAKKQTTQPLAPESTASDVLADKSLSDEEHDLGTSDGCISYILSSFSKSRRDEIKPVAEFFVCSHLKPLCRKEPLWSVFQKQVLNKGILKSTSGRSAWLSAWRANRGKRFAKVAKK